MPPGLLLDLVSGNRVQRRLFWLQVARCTRARALVRMTARRREPATASQEVRGASRPPGGNRVLEGGTQREDGWLRSSVHTAIAPAEGAAPPAQPSEL